MPPGQGLWGRSVALGGDLMVTKPSSHPVLSQAFGGRNAGPVKGRVGGGEGRGHRGGGERQ